ncbi:MAG: hypothetical protein V4490_06020 [Pseudomonadota bacterium]
MVFDRFFSEDSAPTKFFGLVALAITGKYMYGLLSDFISGGVQYPEIRASQETTPAMFQLIADAAPINGNQEEHPISKAPNGSWCNIINAQPQLMADGSKPKGILVNGMRPRNYKKKFRFADDTKLEVSPYNKNARPS